MFSSVPTNPFTPVSGERSSWATVATRSERSRSSRARPRPERITTATLLTGPARYSRLIRPVTRTSVPSEVNHACSGRPTRLLIPSYGEAFSYHSQALAVLQRHHVPQRAARLGTRAEQPTGHVVDQGDGALGIGDHDAVGQRVQDAVSPSTSSA